MLITLWTGHDGLQVILSCIASSKLKHEPVFQNTKTKTKQNPTAWVLDRVGGEQTPEVVL